MKKITVLTLCALLIALCCSVDAQQPKKVPQIGFLAGSREGPSVRAFQQGLRDLGYIEDKNILIAYRYVDGNVDRIPTLVAELVQLKVDVLVVATLVGIRTAKEATKTIPVVMVTSQDPVATGIVESLSRPGGKVTGVTTLTRDLSGKRLELLREALVSISRVGILWDTNAPSGSVNSGTFDLSAEWWNGDPLNGGTLVSIAPGSSQPYSASLTTTPEPATISLAGLVLVAFSGMTYFRSRSGGIRVT